MIQYIKLRMFIICHSEMSINIRVQRIANRIKKYWSICNRQSWKRTFILDTDLILHYLYKISNTSRRPQIQGSFGIRILLEYLNRIIHINVGEYPSYKDMSHRLKSRMTLIIWLLIAEVKCFQDQDTWIEAFIRMIMSPSLITTRQNK